MAERAITTELLDALSAEAAAHPRLRKNLNFHAGDDSPCHRLLNAVEPGTYVQPHRHLAEAKDETMLVVRGRMGLVCFDDAGSVTGTYTLAAGGPSCGIDIPHGTFHSLVSLEQGTVFFEAKGGPYRPLTAGEKAGWAPEEQTAAAAAYLAMLTGLFPG